MGIMDIFQQLKTLVKKPNPYFHMLNEIKRNPFYVQRLLIKPNFISRKLLSFASEAVHPQYWGMSLSVLRADEGSIEVLLPYNLRNSEPGRGLSASSIAKLSEFCLLTFFKNHLNPGVEARLGGLEFNFEQEMVNDVVAKFELQELDRKQLEFELLQEGQLQQDFALPLFSRDSQLICTVTAKVFFTAPRALNEAKR